MMDVLSTPPSTKHAVLQRLIDQKSFPLYSRSTIRSASLIIFKTVSATLLETSKKLLWTLGDAVIAFLTKLTNIDEFFLILSLISVFKLIFLLHNNIEF